MRYFDTDEVSCNCKCGWFVHNDKLFEMIDEARMLANTPFKINSWCRCIEHNDNIGGSTTSSHIIGDAIDISYNNDTDLKHKIMGLLGAGFERILIYPKSKFIHVDIAPDKIKPIIKIMEQE